MLLRCSAQRMSSLAEAVRSPLRVLAAAAVISLGAFGAADRADAGDLFTGQFGAGNTWNVYEAINSPLTWEEAFYYAQSAPDPTGGGAVGHLVVIGGAAENTFVNTNAPGDRWIGLTDRFGVAPGATESAIQLNPQTDGWAWVNGEAFTYQNWGGGEPNDAGNAEDAGQMTGGGTWNDNASGFDIDEPELDFDSLGEGQAIFNFVVEWSTALATQPTLAASRIDPAVLARAFPSPIARLPGPNGTATEFGVREVRDLGYVKNTRQAIANINSGAGTIFDGSSAVLDLKDPVTNGGNTGAVGGTEVPFISHVDGTEDQFVQTVIKGTFEVPAGQGGLYTFNRVSDDGFALRILSQETPGSPIVQHEFIKASNGHVDEDGSLVFIAPGDRDSKGVINLAPGTYDIEFVAFENEGGAYWELSTAKGDFVDPAPNTTPQYILLGDTSTMTGAVYSQPVRMTGNATVNNYAGQTNTIAATITNSRTATPDATGSFDEVVLTDGTSPASICCGRPGATLDPSQVNQFPISTGDDFPDFSTFVTGSFSVTATDTDGLPGEVFTFTLQSDDSSALRIVGEDFTASSPATADGGLSTLGDPESNGDTYLLAGFEGTGNANTFGTITLMEGQTYDFEAWQRQGGGDSGLEVWVAQGDYLATGFDAAAFFHLSAEVLGDKTVAANTGLGLVAGPGTGPAPGIAGDFDGDGDVDGSDFLLWQRDPGVGNLADWSANYGAGGPASGAVPEPGSLGLAIVCAGLIAGCARRRRQA